MWVAVHTTVYTLPNICPNYFRGICNPTFMNTNSNFSDISISSGFTPCVNYCWFHSQLYLAYNLSGNVHDRSIQWYKILKARVPSTKVLLTFLTSALFLCGSGKDAMVFTLYNGFKFYGLYIYLLFWCTTKIRTL